MWPPDVSERHMDATQHDSAHCFPGGNSNHNVPILINRPMCRITGVSLGPLGNIKQHTNADGEHFPLLKSRSLEALVKRLNLTGQQTSHQEEKSPWPGGGRTRK